MKLYTAEQILEHVSYFGVTLEFIEKNYKSKIEINDNVINHVMNDDTIEKLVLCETGHDIKRYNNGK